jgi:hypothetical protein
MSVALESAVLEGTLVRLRPLAAWKRGRYNTGRFAPSC